MATVPNDNLVKAVGFVPEQLTYPIDTSGSFDYNQGDMLMQSAVGGAAKPLDTTGNAQYFIGVAAKSSYLALTVSQQTGSIVKNYNQQSLVYNKGVFSFKTTVGETYLDGTLVYLGADAQTITTVAGGGTSIGKVKLSQGQTSITGAAGVIANVAIVVQLPALGY